MRQESGTFRFFSNTEFNLTNREATQVYVGLAYTYILPDNIYRKLSLYISILNF